MSLPRIRQVVLITDDLAAASAQARELFGFTGGVSLDEEMAKLGFEHVIFSFADTFVEIVSPLDPASPHGRMLEKNGPGGYMVVVQVDDVPALVDRAAGLGFGPIMNEDYHGAPLTQWHPKHLGTLAEIDQVSPPESWHFAPAVFEQCSPDVARDIVAASLVADDPDGLASTWAQLLVREAPQDGVVRLARGETLTILPADGGHRGLRSVDVVAADPARVGDAVELCGVPFRFVAPSPQEQS